VRKKLPADLLLIGIRKRGYFRNCSLECPHHAGIIANRASRNR
jgi:hypothetical protein